MSDIFYRIIAILMILTITFIQIAALTYVACWAFGYTFSIKIALGVYAVIALIKTMFGRTNYDIL